MKKILIVVYICKKGQREAFLNAIQSEGIDKACQNEAGNIRYAYARSIDSDDNLLLVETWKNEEAFQEHCATAHFKRLGELKAQYVVETQIEKYNV